MTRWRYHAFNLLVTTGLLAQLAFSAVFIALGAQPGDFRAPITMLGPSTVSSPEFSRALKTKGCRIGYRVP
jgi:hypothetical protein